MSRIGRLPIAVPAGVTIDIAGQNVTVKGPKGTLSIDVALAIQYWYLHLKAFPSWWKAQ